VSADAASGRDRLPDPTLDRLGYERALTCRYVPKFDWAPEGPPAWTALPRPLHECRLGFVTSGGFYLSPGHEPFDDEPTCTDPSVRELPWPVPGGALRIAHRFYDHRFAREDLETMAPLGTLQTLAGEGRISSVSGRFASFMGYLPHWGRIETELSPAILRLARSWDVDAILLSPG
jgi:hypothetical protein